MTSIHGLPDALRSDTLRSAGPRFPSRFGGLPALLASTAAGWLLATAPANAGQTLPQTRLPAPPGSGNAIGPTQAPAVNDGGQKPVVPQPDGSVTDQAATAVTAQSTADQPTAAPAGPNVQQDIVVTAQKRESSLQRTPIAITAVSGDALQKRQINSIEGLTQSLPSVNFGQTAGNARIAIRGIGYDNVSLGGEARVAYHVDGVYFSRPAAALSSFYDVERVEVLRGPQGTLYGRNATGGAINVITRAPGTDPNGYLEATFGSYGTRKVEGAVGGELTDWASARIAFQVNDRDGYGRDITTNKDIDDLSTRAARAKLVLDPLSWLKTTVTGDYYRQHDHAYGYHYLGVGAPPNPMTTPPLTGTIPRGIAVGGTVAPDPRDSASDVTPDDYREYWGVSIDNDVRLGFATLTLLTAWRSSYSSIVSDIDATSAPISYLANTEDSKQFSQEARLAGDFAHGDWLIGGYYFNERLQGGNRVALDRAALLPVPITSFKRGYYAVGTLDTKAYAGFANLHLKLTDKFGLRLGGRYSNESKSIDEESAVDLATPFPPFGPLFPPTPPGSRDQQNASWSSFTPAVTADYQARDGLYLYATYSQGFKSGGFNLGGLQQPFAPEKLTDYEGGVRADWLNRRLRTNLSAFYYDYSNLQVTQTQGASIIIQNAAKARLYGLEAEVSAIVTNRLKIEGSASLLNSRFLNYQSADAARPTLGTLNLAGKQLTQAPPYTFNLSAEYTLPTSFGDVMLRGEGRFVGKVYFSQYNLNYVSQPAYSLYNAFLTFDLHHGIRATAFVRNLANKRIISSEFVAAGLVGFPLIGTLEPPRTFGITLGYRF